MSIFGDNLDFQKYLNKYWTGPMEIAQSKMIHVLL